MAGNLRAAHHALVLVGEGARNLRRHESLLLRVRVDGLLRTLPVRGLVLLVADNLLLGRVLSLDAVGIDGELDRVGGGPGSLPDGTPPRAPEQLASYLHTKLSVLRERTVHTRFTKLSTTP